MNILLTGANGYIGSHLLPLLVEEKHHVFPLVRSSRRLHCSDHFRDRLTIIEGDLNEKETLHFPAEIDVAFYLVHSMKGQSKGFLETESKSAENFIEELKKTRARQIIYLSGLSHGEHESEHMKSRHHVEEILKSSSIPVTIFRASIIIGSGSASFEIIRDLVEKLPVMVAPKWVKSKSQPIAISDVCYYLVKSMDRRECFNRTFEIGGRDQLTYKEILYQMAEVRGLKRWIITVPVLSPRLSSYWLYFITSVDYDLCKALVDSLKIDAICEERSIEEVIPHPCFSFKEALGRAFEKIKQNAVVSSWRDAMAGSELNPNLRHYIAVPEEGCFKNIYKVNYAISREAVIENIWRLGGEHGWYCMDWAWQIRGYIDQCFKGVGLRRGRTHLDRLEPGDALDFWRVLYADKNEGRLLLYAEMQLPGEAWLEFKIENGSLLQTATFRPKGVLGRLYWYLMFPFHLFIFRGMANAICKEKK